jgi:hypothetical protein
MALHQAEGQERIGWGAEEHGCLLRMTVGLVERMEEVDTALRLFGS